MALPAVPFGMVLGVAMTDSAMPIAVSWASNPLIFAGAAQLVLITLAGTTTWLAMVTTAVVLNLRHVMYSAAVSSRFADQPLWFRIAGPVVLIDQIFALVVAWPELKGDEFRRAYMATAALFVVVWYSSVAAGVLAGDAIPDSWQIETAPMMMFLSIVVLGLHDRPSIAAAVAGGATALVTLDLPNNLGILVSAVVGVAVGVFFDRRQNDKRRMVDEPNEVAS